MRKFKHTSFSAVILTAVLSLSACSQQAKIDAEIKLPVLDSSTGDSFKRAVVTLADIEETKNVGGNIGYVYADTLYTSFESNIVEFVAERGQALKEGDVIAVFDSSSLDYEYNNQKILADDAYAKYLATGSEKARLEYEIQAKQLEYVQYKIDQFTIKAPYDCILTSAENFTAGSVVEYGTKVCTVAKEDEIYLYTGDSTNLFRVGMTVEAKFGTNDSYKGRVVMVPGGGSREKTPRGTININNCVIIDLEEGELERLTSEVDNVISAGWATLIVPTIQKYNVLTLPEEAVATFSGSTYCSILNNGMQVRVPVEVVDVYNGLAVIKSGLEEGDEVIY